MPIASHNQYSYNQIPRNKDLNYTISNSCNSPHRVGLIDWHGNCFVCACEAWLPVNVGHISEFESLADIWSTPAARELQEDIDCKKFSHCAVDRCGILNNDINFDTYELSINIDHSCNLTCPSCRKDHIMISSGQEYDSRLEWVNHTVKLIERFEEPLKVIMTGNGDPLASHIMRPLIANLQPKPNHKFRLFTNGLLIKKHLEKSPLMPNISEVFVSIDAGSEDVYEKVRFPGKWKNLIANLDELKLISDKNPMLVQLNFVLQKDNYPDLQNFVDLCKHYNFNGSIARLEDWGTWDNFAEHDIVNNQEAVELLTNVYTSIKDDTRFNVNPSLLSTIGS